MSPLREYEQHKSAVKSINKRPGCNMYGMRLPGFLAKIYTSDYERI